MGIELFGNDIDEMSDAEVALALAEAAYTRVAQEYAAVKERYAQVTDRLDAATRAAAEESEADSFQVLAEDANLTLYAYDAGEALLVNSRGEFAFELDVDGVEDGDGAPKAAAVEEAEDEFVTLADIETLDAVLVLRRFAGDRDFFSVGAISDSALEALQEAGRIQL